MNAGIIIGVIAGIVILCIIIWAIGVYNGVNRCNLKCDEAESGIDVALQKRHDMLTKLLAAAKKYSTYEQETILKSIELRQDAPIPQKIETNNKLNKLQTSLFGLMENYPDLKASTNWQELQRGIEDAEEHLAAAKRSFNAAATQFNNYKVTFPAKLIAGSMKPDRREYWEADEESKQDVVIE